MCSKKRFDVIIIGGSYSGLAAAMALGRALRNVLIIDSDDPCNKQTPHSHNFLTQDGNTPGQIADIARRQVSKYPTVEFLSDFATEGNIIDNGFQIKVGSGDTYVAKKVVFATGIKDVMPGIPGFAECWGISMLHCPYCHGYEVRNQKTGILANGEPGYEYATLISNWTNDLVLYTNGKPTFSTEHLAKLRRHNIDIVEDEIDSIEHNKGYIRNISFKNGKKAALQALYTRLPFVQHSTIPQAMGCDLTEEGYLKIDPAGKTSILGAFACGDNTTRLRTVANAVSMGTTTGIMVNKELIDDEFNK